MKLLLLLCCLLPTSGFAADLQALLKQGDALDKKFKNAEALTFYLQAEELAPNDPRVLRGLAKQTSEMVLDATTDAEKKTQAEKSVAYAKRAVAVAPKDPLCQLTLAICYGRAAGVLDAKTKIAYSKLIKEHAEIALALDPKNDLTYFVLGAWNYNVANLNIALRAIARVVYGGLPTASNEDALKHLLKASELNPNRVAVQAMIGDTYLAMGNKDQARKSFETALALPNRDKGDAIVKSAAKASLDKLK
jgi:tetratricopeptide (TPR) repeat protein